MVEIAAESRITGVLVYVRGARVTRRARVVAPAGELELIVGGITALAQPGSVRAEVSGGRTVVALRSTLIVPAAPATPGAALARVHALQDRLAALDDEQQTLAARRQALLGVSWQPAFDGGDRRLEPARRTADALATSALCRELGEAIEPRLAALVDEVAEAGRALEAARLEAAQASSRERAGAAPPTRELRVQLGDGAAGALDLDVTYAVDAARWWPAYAARLAEGGARAELELAAFVAQASGEDWTGVRLGLSTAEPVADARLPELASLRLSRRQAPVRRGYRPPPAGLDAMFEAFDRAGPAPPPAPPRPPRPSRSTGSFGAVAAKQAAPLEADTLFDAEEEASADGAAPMPMPASAPRGFVAPAPQLARARVGAAAPGGGGGAAVPVAHAPAALEPADAWLDFDRLTLGRGEDGAARGRLQRPPLENVAAIAQAARQMDTLAAPARAVDPRGSRGMFDHRHDASAALDVPSDALVHRVPLLRAEAPARPRFVTVPRELAEVYREVALDNPFDAPLLPGPCEVYVEGVLLTTTALTEVGKGGSISLGLGVEERLRVARNARVEEQSAGLLGGSTTIDHKVSIELRSSLGRAVTVEVIDRVPVSDDDDIEIDLYSKPAPEAYEQIERGAPLRGGLRWRVALPAGGQASIEHAYRIKLSAKNELAGGNRRE